MVLARILCALFVTCFTFITSASALVLDRATVGADDTFSYLCPDASPSDANEVACFGLAGIGTSVFDIDKPAFSFVELTDDAGVYATALPTGYHSSHFLIKTGNIGGADKQYSFIFKNNAETGYAVFNLSVFQALIADNTSDAYIDGANFANIGKISHITVFTYVTPLPAALWMFLTAFGGIFGLKKYSRRRKAVVA